MKNLLDENVLAKILKSTRLSLSALGIAAVAGVFGAVTLPMALVIGGIVLVYVASETIIKSQTKPTEK